MSQGTGGPSLFGQRRGTTAEAARRLVRRALDHGINLFDTAQIYDESEVLLGQALDGVPRDSYLVATKYRYADDEGVIAPSERRRVPSIVRLTACGWTSSTSCKSTDCCPSTMTRSSRGTCRFSRTHRLRERSASSAFPNATPKTPRTPRCAAPRPTATSTRQWSATTCCTKEPSGTSSPPLGPRILASSS